MNNDLKFWGDLYTKTGNSHQSPHTSENHKTLLSIIPDDVETILDAGCGGGSLMTYLSKCQKYRVEGVDQSHEGVRFINEELNMNAQVGDITKLNQYKDNSFDLVICSEVLEHLPIQIMDDAIKELVRVAKKYVVITNPFKEQLTYHQFTCNHCFTRYHPAGHIHSVTESFLMPFISPWSDSICFFYSGKREYSSALYASFLRMLGYRLLNLESFCPLCETEMHLKKWGVPVRITGHIYRALQKILRMFGVYQPANIITLIKTK